MTREINLAPDAILEINPTPVGAQDTAHERFAGGLAKIQVVRRGRVDRKASSRTADRDVAQ